MSLNQVLLVSLLAVFLSARNLPGQPAEPGTPSAGPEWTVVRTWGDLLAQQPLPLASGGSVRLGVSSSEAAAGEPILVYCATRDAKEPSGRVAFEGNLLGPLSMTVRPEGELERRQLQSLMQQIAAEYPDRSWRLYATPVVMCRPGRYVLSLKTLDGKQVAGRKLRCNKSHYHAWMRWGMPEKLRQLREREDGYADEGIVTSARGPAVVPGCNGMSPIAMSPIAEASDEGTPNAGKERLGRPLPTLAPKESDLLKLRVVGGDLWLESPRNLDFQAADENLLVRWWVNGKPVAPLDRQAHILEGGGLLRKLSKEPFRIHLDLDFDAAQLGAKSGDQLGLQVLYTRFGWQPTEGEGPLRAFATHESMPITLLSNRVEWKVP